MKNDFLTIPDAPNYEVNSELIVRNKKTSHIKKTSNINGSLCVTLYLKNGKHLIRTPKRLRSEACAAVSKVKFFPVPSLNYKYEINRNGVLRNAKTKRRLKLTPQNCYSVKINGKCNTFGQRTLKAEVFGTKPAWSPVQCVLSKNDRRVYFDNLKMAARFLSPQVFYAPQTLYQKYFYARKTYVFGWQVEYLDAEPRDYAKSLNREARRNQKAWS